MSACNAAAAADAEADKAAAAARSFKGISDKAAFCCSS
jgi:hypothetical protein